MRWVRHLSSWSVRRRVADLEARVAALEAGRPVIVQVGGSRHRQPRTSPSKRRERVARRGSFADMTQASSDYERELIPVEYAQPGTTLLVDRGQGAVLFQVEGLRVKSTRQDDGSHLTKYTLTSGPPVGGGDPWTLELPAGSDVVAVYRKGRRPMGFPPRG